VNNKDYPASLELRKLYQVVADEAAAKPHQLRVIDESGEDYLYPEEYFVPVQLPQAAREGCAARGKPHFCEITTSRDKQPGAHSCAFFAQGWDSTDTAYRAFSAATWAMERPTLSQKTRKDGAASVSEEAGLRRQSVVHPLSRFSCNL
jgi:hypothetical protein